MMPGMNPRKMQQAMKKMGISQVDIPATEVIIRQEDRELVFTNPQVAKVNMMGQNTYQIVGEPEERGYASEISDDDVKTVMDQAEVDEESARQALEDSEGDIAEAIMKIQDGSS